MTIMSNFRIQFCYLNPLCQNVDVICQVSPGVRRTMRALPRIFPKPISLVTVTNVYSMFLQYFCQINSKF